MEQLVLLIFRVRMYRL